ncbi:transcription termination/antitermination protein NusG [Bremerella sp. JC770]|uniref:transcription termination/antitermination protein NusG n=1 Tax=Bremerella sp. JC770 TaxID=3232137 RepID=UPI0034588683
MASSPDNSFDPQKDPEVEIPADAEATSEDAATSEAASDEPASTEAGGNDATDGDATDGDAADSAAADSDVAEGVEAAAEEAVEEPGSDEPADPAPAAPAASGKNRGPIEEITEEEDEAAMDAANKEWYILKVQSNREKSISNNLIRRVKMAGLEDYFGEILVPTEDLVEYKNGKKKVTKQKLYPGYIVVHMAINDETWFLVRETGGIGDFTGAAGKPVPMLPHEVDRIVKKTRKPDEGEQEEVKTNIRFKIGDHVRITEGTFENFEGDVEVIDNTNGRVTVMINIFGRTTPVEMEHWQMEPV